MLYFEDAGTTIYNYISYIIDIYKSEEDEVKSRISKLISLQKRQRSNAGRKFSYWKREREWTVVGCDGPPYCLASRVIDNDKNKYDWVTMQPGLGHLNMNQLKGFFKVIAMCSLFS